MHGTLQGCVGIQRQTVAHICQLIGADDGGPPITMFMSWGVKVAMRMPRRGRLAADPLVPAASWLRAAVYG